MANTPAENVKYTRGVNGDTPTLTLEGTMREMFSETFEKIRFAFRRIFRE